MDRPGPPAGTFGAVLFTADAHAGLASGAITLTFRAWSRPQVKVGGRYNVGGTDTTLQVDDVRQLRVSEITDADARRAGAADREAVIARLGAPKRGRYHKAPGTEISPDRLVWRVAFHRVDSDPPLADQADLTPDDLAELDRRLDRLDAASSYGPWSRTTLQLIADRPGVVSTVLAESLGRERQAFKTDVRKLKRLGLTISLDVGYRLSPRGHAYLREIPNLPPK